MEIRHYINYDPQAIWQDMIRVWTQHGGDIIYPGDEKEMLMRTLQAVTVDNLAKVDAGLLRRTLRGATQEDLDDFGESNFCPRIEAAAARGKVKISLKASGQSGVIEAGTEMTADGSVYYRTTEEVAVSGYAQDVVAGIECTQAGEAGNGLAAGVQMQTVKSAPLIRRIEVYEATAGGNEREEDDAYRERIRTNGLADVTTGAAARYEAVARAVSSAILDARAKRLSAGQVGTYLLIEEGADAQSLIEQVKAAQSARTARPLTDYVVVEEAQALAYVLNITCRLEETAAGNAAAAIEEAVKSYREWQDYTLGRAFNPDYLVAKLYQAGAMRVQIAPESSFNGGAAQYTAIEEGQRCLGEVNIVQEES